MSLENLYILDVGHGNCSLVVGEDKIAIVDAPKGPTLSDALQHLGITHVDNVFVSHADADHIVGISTLLLNKEVTIDNLHVNPDGEKNTDAWFQFRMAAQEASRRGTTITGINTSMADIDLGTTSISILAPETGDFLAGAGGKSLNGDKITANSISVVLKVSYDGKPRALLAGDIEDTALERLLKNGRDLSASILIFPHHGGLPNKSDPEEFAQKLCESVSPELVIFSNSRAGRFDNPRPEIITGVSTCGARVACTQLSKKCHDETKGLDFSHLGTLPSKGIPTNSSCAGSMVFDLEAFDISNLNTHISFVEGSVNSALCKKLNCTKR